jgi:hypothetical protein
MAKNTERAKGREREIHDAVKIEPMALEEEFIRVPADIAYFGEKHSAAVRKKLLAKHDFERVEAKLYMEIREEADTKITEATIRAKMLQNEEHYDAKLVAIEAEADEKAASHRLSALLAKRDALINLGANYRAEMGGNPSIRAQARGARDVASSRDEEDDD